MNTYNTAHYKNYEILYKRKTTGHNENEHTRQPDEGNAISLIATHLQKKK